MSHWKLNTDSQSPHIISHDSPLKYVFLHFVNFFEPLILYINSTNIYLWCGSSYDRRWMKPQ